jgi:hypothetical protein
MNAIFKDSFFFPGSGGNGGNSGAGGNSIFFVKQPLIQICL